MNRRPAPFVRTNMDQLALVPLASTDEPGPRAELVDPAGTVRFLLAGNAHVTFQSRRTGARFTYRVRAAKTPSASRPHFVSVLVGSDNGEAYSYLGCVFGGRMYVHGKKSPIDRAAPSAAAFAWAWAQLTAGRMPESLAVWHEGRCGKCHRRLTDPTSISTGLGPVCGSRE